MKYGSKIRKLICRYAYAGVLLIAAGCFALLLFSYAFPKYAYDITDYHVILEEGEEEELIPLSPGTVVAYHLHIDGDPIDGIEPCYDWGSDMPPTGTVKITAWHEEGYPSQDAYISECSVVLDQTLRTAYAYTAMPNSEQLTGDLVFEITYQETEQAENYPAVVATNLRMEESSTYVNGALFSGDLLMYYVGMRATYPLVFDARTTLLLLLAVFFTMSGHHKKEGIVDETKA